MKSVLVIGMGTMGIYLARKMQDLGNEVMIADKDEELIQELSPEFNDAFCGDCSADGILKSIGVNTFDYCFVTIGEDFYASLEITSILKELGAKYVIAKAKRSRQVEFLKKIGADEVVYPDKEIAENLAVRYNADNIFDYIELTSEYSIFEIPVVSSWIGKKVKDVDVRRKHNINIIAVKNDNELNLNLGGDYVFDENDHLVVLGKSSDVFRVASNVKRPSR